MNNELNKYIYTDEFFKLYPEISDSTFRRWTLTGKRIKINKKWSKPYILEVIRQNRHGVSILIPLKSLSKFFKQIGEEEWALRVPSYIRKITN